MNLRTFAVASLCFVSVFCGCEAPPAARPRTRTVQTPMPRGPAPMLPPSAQRVAALSGIDPVWVERTRIASMYDGVEAYMRLRTPGATGPATRANTHPTLVILGDRSGSRGADRDRDGLSDEAEVRIGTNPDAFDTDGDTLPDAFEIFATGTLPTVTDTDGDGMPDAQELNLDDPNSYADTDGDGFKDGQERAAFNTDPRSVDSDGDGFGDDLEYFLGTAMNDSAQPTVDSDEDGEPDDYERANGTDPAGAGSKGADGDDDDVPDWLDPDSVMAARARGRQIAVPANSVDCNPNSRGGNRV
jgi:hypothetical protein